ncbi:RING finger protein 10-like isoform X2 [Hibiscus syriacus]|uniref:RING finger protein 10-like isoform X2 n=1 Tax=Hibiscus syriacus TaxID=106335 RepID=UPI001923AD6A|nr:RING finger protein 10-like isoform X2 [Hibiscus syriacus]
MFILPSQAQGSKASSSRALPQNPNSNHGNHLQSSPPISFGSLHISDPPSPLSLSTSPPGTLASDAQVSAESSKELREVDTPSVKRTSVHRNRRTNSHPRGKMSEDMISTQNHQSTVAHGGATYSGGKRTQMTNFNHLLNFHYDPIVRSRPQPRGPPPRRQRKIKPYNKDLFIQANFKFVVLDTGHYTPELMDPDKNLLWEDIICVRYSTPFPVQCPICLEHPQCPQITSCGHIFCFPCILQYLFMGEDDQKRECFKRCPLCFLMVSQKDLYTIYIENVRQYCVGDTIEFMLLTREKDSFVPSQKSKNETNYTQCGENEIYDPFSKFIFTSDVDLSVRQAMSDLDSWLARADSGLVDDLEKLPYVCAAMEQLEQRKKYWKEHRATDRNKARITTVCKVESDRVSLNASSANGNIHSSGGRKLSSEADEHNKCIFNSKTDTSNGGSGLDHSAVVGESLEAEDSSLSLSNEESKNLLEYLDGSKDTKDNGSYNFYQALDGQHIILHPLNVKCLLHHYGSYDSFPHRVSGRILELETVTQSEAVRRRYRYLSHFSLTTTFQLCEIDLSGILPPDALLPFMDEIKRREKQRKQLARKEQKEKIKAEVAATVQFTPMISSSGHSSYNDSPSFSMDDFEALGSSNVISSSPVTGERKLFSNVTRLGFAAAHDSPSLKIEEGNGTHYNGVATDSSGSAGSRNSGTPSFANVISRAKAAENLQTPKMNEMGKKGKKGGRVLLSTTSGRRY